ncbi:MAG: hypothetical protein QNL51_07995 [Opitutaceae bacterium]|tara:strand:+ start:2612 stop:2821 length:210 start_codon:yes stop_codon:yes gene_type:complete
MKKKITLPLVTIIGIFLSGCGTPISKENPHSRDQLRFEQQQAGYPDPHSSDQEAKADRQYRGAQKFQKD